MVCGAIAEQGRKGEVPVREKWVVVVWVVVEVEEDAQASRWRDCHRALWLELELSWAVELEMLDVVVQGMSRVVGTERLVQCVATVGCAMGSGGGVACEYGQGYCIRLSRKVGDKSSQLYRKVV